MKLELVAVAGGESLLGREIRELAEKYVPYVRMKFLGAEAGEDEVAEGAEKLVLTAVDREDIGRARVLLLAGSAVASAQVTALVPEDGATIVDLTGEMEDHPRARVRAPMAEPEGFTVEAGAVHVVAHPAAVALAMLLTRLHGRCPIRRSVVQVFEPASEQGQQGLTELQQQTVGLLSFKPLKKDVYDTQASFAMLPRFGSDAPRALAEIEHRMERHLATLLSRESGVPMPSLRLVQAPVFHGHTFSLWVEFERNPGTAAIEEALASARIEVRTGDEEPPTNVGVAGQSGLTVGALHTDANHPAAAWLWMVADNLRLRVENGLMVTQSLVGEGGRE